MSVALCMPLLKDEDFKGYVSRKKLEESLRELIEKAFYDRRFVFVYGMGGSGKTTLVNKILRDLGYDYAYIHVMDEGVRYEFGRKLDYTDGETAYWIVKKLYESFKFREGLKGVALRSGNDFRRQM